MIKSNSILGASFGISQGLLSHLDKIFPDTLPTHSITVEELRFLQGQRRVIEKLKELSEEDFNYEE
tara:strand:+ start:53 stop:250 length:198 start_codon:yes stop_codon:yes gene_type:complete